MTTLSSYRHRCFLVGTAAFIFLFLTVLRGESQVVTITDSTAPTNAVTVTPLSTFTFSINLTTTVSTAGITYRLTETTGPGGHFLITARDTTVTVFGDLTATNAVVLQSANALLDPSNNNDLGGTIASSDPVNPKPAGSYFLATFTLQALSTTPAGTYSIQLTSDSILANADFSETPITASPYLVTVVPEPSSLAFVGLFGCAMLLMKRKVAI